MSGLRTYVSMLGAGATYRGWAVDATTGFTFSENNFKVARPLSGTTVKNILSEAGKSSGKFYVEMECVSANTAGCSAGLARITTAGSTTNANTGLNGWSTNVTSGQLRHNNKVPSPANAASASPCVVMLAIDLDNDRLYTGANGNWRTGTNIPAGTGWVWNDLTGTIHLYCWFQNTSSPLSSAKIRQPAEHSYAAPAGFELGWPD